jgi:protein ImuA
MLLDLAPRPRPGDAPAPLLRGLNEGADRAAIMNEPESCRAEGLDRRAVTAALKARVARLPAGTPDESGAISLSPEIDGALPGHGLTRAALHEIHPDDTGAAQGFAALLMARAGGTVVWIAIAPDAPPPGLGRFGLAPSRLIVLRPRERADALWAAEEALRCPAISAVLLSGMSVGEEGMHRLQVAAGTGGGIGLLLRDQDEEETGYLPVATSWRVSGRGSGGGELGDPQWTLELLRGRTARQRSWAVTWRTGLEALVPEEDARDEARPPAPVRARRR